MSIKNARRTKKDIVTQKRVEEAKIAEKPSDYDPPPNDVQPSTWLKLDHLARNGARYRANVLYTVPTFDDLIAIGQLKTTMAGNGIHFSADAVAVAHSMAYMMTCFDEETLPTWWKPDDGRDFTPYQELYALAVAYETKYFRGGANESAAPVSTGDEEPNVRGSARADAGAVVGPVQPAAKRREILSPDPA